MSLLQPIKAAKPARIGLYSVGLQAYWAQFPGLRERLVGYGEFLAREMGKYGEVHNYGLVDTAALMETLGPRKQAKAYLFGHSHRWQHDRTDDGLELINLPTLVKDAFDPHASMDMKALAQRLGVNRSTVLSAYRELKQDGLVESRVGHGTTVLPRPAGGLPAHPHRPFPWRQALRRLAGA